jgi:hypothetical protein
LDEIDQTQAVVAFSAWHAIRVSTKRLVEGRGLPGRAEGKILLRIVSKKRES